MATLKDKLDKIKALFVEDVPTEPAKPAFSEMTLADGTILMVEGELIPGAPIMVKTDTGTAAAAAGDYVLADGSTITVDQEGKLVEVKAAEGMAVENPEVAALKERVTALENSLKSATDTANAATSAATTATEQMKKTEEASKQLLDLFEEFIKTPETKVEQFTSTTQESPTDKIQAVFQGIQNLKGKK